LGCISPAYPYEGGWKYKENTIPQNCTDIDFGVSELNLCEADNLKKGEIHEILAGFGYNLSTFKNIGSDKVVKNGLIDGTIAEEMSYYFESDCFEFLENK